MHVNILLTIVQWYCLLVRAHLFNMIYLMQFSNSNTIANTCILALQQVSSVAFSTDHLNLLSAASEQHPWAMGQNWTHVCTAHVPKNPSFANLFKSSGGAIEYEHRGNQLISFGFSFSTGCLNRSPKGIKLTWNKS